MSAIIKRRDLLEACKLAKVTLNGLEDSSLGQLALAYLVEKRAGETDLDFDAWLDEDLDLDDGVPGAGGDGEDDDEDDDEDGPDPS
jgi:hypothetical protein